jgi:hypothetical protein
MNDVWTCQTIAGAPVVERRVCYGSEPDFEFVTQLPNGEYNFYSAFDMYENKTEYSQ